MRNSTADGAALADRIARQRRDEALLSDPAVSINFVRHVAALKALLTGRPNCRTGFPEPVVLACFVQGWTEFESQLGFFSLTGRDHVLLRFERENPLGRPIAIDVVSHVGDQLETDTGVRTVVAGRRRARPHHVAGCSCAAVLPVRSGPAPRRPPWPARHRDRAGLPARGTAVREAGAVAEAAEDGRA